MKNFFTKKSLLLLGLFAVLTTACGLEVVNVLFSKKDMKTGEYTTLTTTFELGSDKSWSGNWNMLYAVRIPSTWSAETMHAVIGDNTIKFNSCQAYATMLQFCFPEEGYKWVGFVSSNQQGNPFSDTVTSIQGVVDLKAGALPEGVGEAAFDKFAVMVGGTNQSSNFRFIDENGALILGKAFGCNYNGEEQGTKKLSFDGAEYEVYATSEYLFDCGTIAKSERDAAVRRLLADDDAMVNGFHVYPSISDEVEHDFTNEFTVNVRASSLESSCFASVNMHADRIAPNGTVMLSAKIENAGQFGSDDEAYGLIGIRVPAEWTAETPVCVNEPEGKQIAFAPSKAYSDFLNYAFPLEGYVWAGFETVKENFVLPADKSGYLAVSSNLTAGQAVGNYKIDMVFGYSHHDFAETYITRDEDGNHSTNEDGSYDFRNEIAYPTNNLGLGQARREFLVTGTLSSEDIKAANDAKSALWDFHLADLKNHMAQDAPRALAVEVANATMGIEAIAADEFEIVGDRGGVRVNSKGASVEGAAVSVYNAQGVMTDSKLISGGSALLSAHKGVCLVEVVKGNRKAVRKIVVK